MTDQQYVSTGAAARMLGVTPDTVLKWIKRGRLTARRTAGGHFRVARSDLARLQGTEIPSDEVQAERPSAPMSTARHVYCWEYHAEGGVVRADCKRCKAFHAKALRCFELRCLPSGMGSPNDFCATTCDVCGYFREHVRGPVRVLVVTDSVSLREQLGRAGEQRPVRFEFAAREYECAGIVEGFKPEFAILDGALPRAIWTTLARCMTEDPRAKGISIVLLAPPRSKRASAAPAPESGVGVRAVLERPLEWAELEVVLGLRCPIAVEEPEERTDAPAAPQPPQESKASVPKPRRMRTSR